MTQMRKVTISELCRDYVKPLTGEETMLAQPERPIDPDPGTVWYDTTIGKAYVYYNDGHGTSDWVEFGVSKSGR